MNPVVLIACLSPIAIIWIVMKLSLLMFSDPMTNEGMSKQNPKNHTDLMWQTHMQTLTKRKRSMEIAQTIDKALEDYYSEKGEPVPQWRTKKDPDWWVEYLRELEEE